MEMYIVENIAARPDVAVSQGVELVRSVAPRAAGLANAVLRRVDRERDALPPLPDAPDARLSIEYSYPLWLVRLWCAERGEAEARQLLAAAPRPLSVRAQYPETTEGVLAALPCGATRGRMDENCLYLDAGMDVTADPLFQAGRLAVQGEGAMLACRALGDCRGRRVLDACAAPGGKSVLLSAKCASVVSQEIYPHRAGLIERYAERMGVSNIRVRVGDASAFVPEWEDAFDAVLCDVPCSGSGVINENPDIKLFRREEDVASLAAVQQKIIANCARYVRPGGSLYYSTCSVLPEENDSVIFGFLASRGDFAADIPQSPLPARRTGYGLQFLPHISLGAGFFLSRLKRTE